MRRIKHSPRKMQYQVFKYALALPLLILLLFSLILYFYVSRILIDREHVALRSLNGAQMNQIEANLQNLDYVTADLNYVNRLTGFLTDSSDWSKQENVRNTVLSIVGSERKAYQVNLYPLSGEMTELGTVDEVIPTENRDSVWLQQVMDLRGSKLLSVPYNTTRHSYSGERKWLLSLSRAALNSRNQVIGALEAIGRCEQIFSAAISYSHQQQEPSSLYIFAPDGTLVYPYDLSDEEQAALHPVFRLTVDNSDEPQDFKDPESGEVYQYVRTHSNYSDWSYISLQKRSVIFRPVHRLIELLAGVAVVLFLLSALFSWHFARRMVRPVKKLQQLVKDLRLDTLGQIRAAEVSSVPYEELDEVFREFRTMSESLEGSLNELEVSRDLEFKAQMTALQMQMNPHFYNNMLTCISELAENGQRDEVASMCRTLSDLMRYITDSNSSEVMLFQELGIIRKYLYCMEMRYQEDLKITLEADDALNTILVPKLILQPLVENAVKYGTEGNPPWHLRITGRMEEDRWYFTIEDSGSGFSQESVRQLSDQIREIDSADRSELSPQKIEGMGILNVYMRWKLYCHGSEIFEFGNRPDGHTYVTIGRRKD